MTLAKILAYAQSQGSTLILSSLLPDGFECWPAESRETRMERVLAFAREQDEAHSFVALAETRGYERRGPRGQIEDVRGHEKREAEALREHLMRDHDDVAAHQWAGELDNVDSLDRLHFDSHDRSWAPQYHEYQSPAHLADYRTDDYRTGLSRVLVLAGESQVKGFERTVRGKEEFVRPHASMEHGWAHPEAVGGHKITGVFTHPKTGNALYDLGNGLHAEGVPGKGGQFKAGAVMKSNQGLQKEALAQKGWKLQRPPKPGTAGVAKPGAGKPAGASALEKVTGKPQPGRTLKLKPPSKAGAAKKAQHGLADQQRDYMQRAGYKVNPHDWQQDWVPPHEDKIHFAGDQIRDWKDLNKPGRPLGQATGKADDPIDVKGDIKEALRQLAAGKHVRLNRPTELTLLMQEIQRHAAESEAAGKDEKPDWDFGRLSVKGTNLFAAQSKGIRRINMPQFSGLAEPGTHAAQVAGGPGKFADLTDEFEQHLKDHGVKVEHTTVPAGHLRATQSELVGSKVAGFANAFLHGNPKAVNAMKEPIMVTKDGYVIDGHHRWGANMLVDAVDGRLNSDTPMNVRKVDMEIGSMIPLANEWARQVGIASAAAKAGDTGAALKK